MLPAPPRALPSDLAICLSGIYIYTLLLVNCHVNKKINSPYQGQKT